MDSEKSLKLKPLKRDKFKKSRAVQNSEESSTEENSDEEFDNTGSRVKLFQEKRKSFKSPKKGLFEKSGNKSGGQKSESTTVHNKSKESVKSSQPKESSLAQSIRRKFSFFRRSENNKSAEDVEAAVIDNNDTHESEAGKMVDVIVDVHQENGDQRKSSISKKSSPKFPNDVQQSDNSESSTSPDELIMKSLDKVEKVHKDKNPNKKNVKSNLFDSESELVLESEIDTPVSVVRENNKSIDEVTSEAVLTSERDSSHRRRRWTKSEISADNLVENLQRPRRRQWTKDVVSADVHKVIEKKVSAPKRSTTANPDKVPKPISILTSTPVPAPRSKHKKKKDYQAFDNDGYLFDQDEVLRIETIEDSSPQIKIGSTKVEKFEDEPSSLSTEDKILSDTMTKVQKLQTFSPSMTESTENSILKEQSLTDSSESSHSFETKITSRRRSSNKPKLSVDERFTLEKDEQDEADEDQDEQDTVLNIIGKKSSQSSGSSQVNIIPSYFFNKKLSDDTTISTSGGMISVRRISHRSRSRSKSKISKKRRDEVENISEISSRTKSKTNSSSMRNSAEEFGKKNTTKSRTKKHQKRREKDNFEDGQKDVKYVSIRIHRADILEADYITRHPMVRVHIVNLMTGEYLKTRNKEKKDVIVQPILTRKFDFMEKQSMVPIWEEEIIFELNFMDMLKEGKDSVIILFEIVDLLKFSEASASYDRFGRDSCWYKVAWAFLRPVGTTGVHHVEKKLRLQLYKPKKTFRKFNQNICEVHRWWKSRSRDKYPSSLYVTLNAVDQPKLEPILYEQLLPLEDVLKTPESSRQEMSDRSELPEPTKWMRRITQPCQIPNDTHLEIEASENGCFHLTFSNDGKFLACALSEECDYPILVYKVQDGKTHVRFSGHKNFIYSLSWSQDDRFLLSVSSDRTARFWNVREKIIGHVQSLPHPSYVYCGKFSLEPSNYIVTGCYDRIARVWALLGSNGTEQYELVQELEAHGSFVNTLCFQTKNETFYTGDGLGVIIAWSGKKSRQSPIRKEWKIMRKIKIKELEGVPINTIIIHPLGTRLIVHSRNNGLRLLDLITGSVIKKFDGLLNQRIQISACISPCGTLLFCGGEDSTLNVWSLETSKQVAIYQQSDGHDKTITCVDYHPNDQIIAFSVYGVPVPVKILKYDREVDGKNVRLKLLAPITSAAPINVNPIGKPPKKPIIVRNGERNSQMLSARSGTSSINFTHYSFNHLHPDSKVSDEVGVHHHKGRVNSFVENGTNLKAKSINRLNGIIEKIDRILLYATSQKPSARDLESGRTSPIFTVSEREPPRRPIQVIELKELAGEDQKRRKQRYRTRSERNSSSSLVKETELAKAFSDSAAFIRKVSRFSDDSTNSTAGSGSHRKVVVERLELERINQVDTESGFKDSLDTIVDGREDLDFTSEEVLDIESLKSDDTYVVEKDKKLPAKEDHYFSEQSNATFVIESGIPIPKPRKRIGRIEVM